jgi:choline dehydrogenase-like flavoprotein
MHLESQVVVVGSGLSAVGSIRALISKGIKPLVLDIGVTLPSQSLDIKKILSSKNPSDWNESDLGVYLGKSNTSAKGLVPRKTIFGSDFFYSGNRSLPISETACEHSSPPYSEALGGFSAGWGAAFLPPASSDLADWPINHSELLLHMRLCTEGIAKSEPFDALDNYFGRLSEPGNPSLPLSDGQTALLERIKRSVSKNSISPEVVGQSRLLTTFDKSDSLNNCRFCGYCSSGCSFDSIYKAEFDIREFIDRGLIEYRPNVQVLTITDSIDGVSLTARSSLGGERLTVSCEKLFLAAGAVGSAKILLQSKEIFGHQVFIRRTGGFIEPFISVARHEIEWPNVNTQTSLYLDFVEGSVSTNWVHAQISLPNEIVLAKLGLDHGTVNSMRGKIARFLAAHLVFAIVNTHSDFGPIYNLKLERDTSGGGGRILSSQYLPQHAKDMQRVLNRRLKRILRRRGIVGIDLLQQDSVAAAGYHFGASFPMKAAPNGLTDTDVLGRPFGWRNVHVVDTSVLPNIPGTTVGLLTMANAHRIASEAV